MSKEASRYDYFKETGKTAWFYTVNMAGVVRDATHSLAEKISSRFEKPSLNEEQLQGKIVQYKLNHSLYASASNYSKWAGQALNGLLTSIREAIPSSSEEKEEEVEVYIIMDNQEVWKVADPK